MSTDYTDEELDAAEAEMASFDILAADLGMEEHSPFVEDEESESDSLFGGTGFYAKL